MLYLQYGILLLTAMLWAWLAPLYFLLSKTINVSDCITSNIRNSTMVESCYIEEDYSYFIRSSAFVFGSWLGASLLFTTILLISTCDKCCFEPICTYEVRYWDYFANKYYPKIAINPKEEMKVEV